MFGTCLARLFTRQAREHGRPTRNDELAREEREHGDMIYVDGRERLPHVGVVTEKSADVLAARRPRRSRRRSGCASATTTRWCTWTGLRRRCCRASNAKHPGPRRPTSGTSSGAAGTQATTGRIHTRVASSSRRAAARGATRARRQRDIVQRRDRARHPRATRRARTRPGRTRTCRGGMVCMSRRLALQHGAGR